MKYGFIALCICATVLFVVPHVFAADDPQIDSDGDGYPDVLELETGHDPMSTSTAILPKTIKVALKEQMLRYYTGEYLVREIKISSGLPSTPTPPGTYSVQKKLPFVNYTGPNYSYPNTKWNMLFKRGSTGGYYIHGAYWHNKFGRPASHGCVNVAYKDMERLYNWASVGTTIMIQ